MQRSEILECYKWDLTDLFETDEAWEKAFLDINNKIQAVVAFKGKVLQDSQTLLESIKATEELNRQMGNVLVYARLKMDENTKNPTYQGLVSRAEKLASTVGEAVAFMKPEILSVPFSVIDGFMKENETLGLYGKYFDDLFRRKPHVLSEEMESVLAKVSELGSVPSSAYGMLLNADLTFEDVMDSKGEKHPLTNGSYIPMMMSEDRMLRQNAFESYYKVYAGHINTIATLMRSEVNKNMFFSKTRNHASSREAALFENKVPTSVPDGLIEAVNANLDVFHKYMSLRKRVMGVEELHMYDIYTPIVSNVDFKIPYEEAKNIVTESLSVLGEAYQNTIRSAFEKRWIDVYETEGKRGGAYSWGTYDSKPYVLLNHKDNMDSMFTLTHELGHSMHSYLTRKNQPYVYGNYSIFVAEVASTTNEALLNDYLMKTETEPEKRKYILNHYLEQFRGTIFRQTMFAEFERDIHKYAEEGGALTADYLCNHYLELNKKYYGPDVVVDEAIKYEWARIPHMYYNFYVYQYATGFSAAIALASGMLKEGKPAVDKYLEFLSSGSKDYPINILKAAGADMETAGPVNNALSVFRTVVDEFDKLL